LLCCVAVAAGVVGDAEASLLGALAAALEANRPLSELAGGLIEENARLRARDAERDAEFEKLRGARWSLGPRAARLHVGAGRSGVSTGAGPVSWYRRLRRRGRRSGAAEGHL
jgi:hypothetical protein